jgi:hypothetical protein
MHVRVDVREPGSGDERVERLCQGLAGELHDLGVGSVSVKPPRALEVSPASPGAETLRSVVAGVRDWLRRSPVQRSVGVSVGDDTVELTGASDELGRPVVTDWIGRHAIG